MLERDTRVTTRFRKRMHYKLKEGQDVGKAVVLQWYVFVCFLFSRK